jgi:hypothetical protein
VGGIGDGWLFPRADGSGPWPREIFGEQLLVAEEKPGLEHLKGGAWHPFRRKWATERKDLPLVDVKATGGWRDTNTLLTCYQQTDDASMLRVMEAPRKLRGTGRLKTRNYGKTMAGGQTDKARQRLSRCRA